MYEHPSYQYTRFDQEQLAKQAEQRRFIEEHAHQIVVRTPGIVRRMLRRLSAAVGRPTARTTPGPASREPSVVR